MKINSLVCVFLILLSCSCDERKQYLKDYNDCERALIEGLNNVELCEKSNEDFSKSLLKLTKR